MKKKVFILLFLSIPALVLSQETQTINSNAVFGGIRLSSPPPMHGPQPTATFLVGNTPVGTGFHRGRGLVAFDLSDMTSEMFNRMISAELVLNGEVSTDTEREIIRLTRPFNRDVEK